MMGSWLRRVDAAKVISVDLGRQGFFAAQLGSFKLIEHEREDGKPSLIGPEAVEFYEPTTDRKIVACAEGVRAVCEQVSRDG